MYREIADNSVVEILYNVDTKMYCAKWTQYVWRNLNLKEILKYLNIYK